VRTEFIAYFLALLAIPVAQVLADAAFDRHHLIFFNRALDSAPIAVSKYRRAPTPFDYLFLPRQQQPQRTS